MEFCLLREHFIGGGNICGFAAFWELLYVLIFNGMIVAFPPTISPQVCVFTR